MTDEKKDATVQPANSFAPSGAPQQTTDFDPNHPAVDADPRANATEVQNRIDFNDPNLSGGEAVANALKKQGVPTAVDADEKASK